MRRRESRANQYRSGLLRQHRCFLPVARAFACLESVRSSFCASGQASAICAGVARFRSAMRFSSSTIAMFAARASAAKRGEMLRKSVPLKVVLVSIVPVRKPAPSGLNGRSRFQVPRRWRARRCARHRASTMSTRSERRDGLDGVCTTDGLAARLGQPEVLHLALLNQFLHGAGNVLDGDSRVHAVLITHR